MGVMLWKCPVWEKWVFISKSVKVLVSVLPFAWLYYFNLQSSDKEKIDQLQEELLRTQVNWAFC